MSFYPVNAYPGVWDPDKFPPAHRSYLVPMREKVFCVLCKSTPYSYEQIDDHCAGKLHMKQFTNLQSPRA